MHCETLYFLFVRSAIGLSKFSLNFALTLRVLSRSVVCHFECIREVRFGTASVFLKCSLTPCWFPWSQTASSRCIRCFRMFSQRPLELFECSLGVRFNTSGGTFDVLSEYNLVVRMRSRSEVSSSEYFLEVQLDRTSSFSQLITR